MDIPKLEKELESLEGIKKFFPFLYKLHMITNKANHPFIVWSKCGLNIEVDYMSMQDYLMTKSSIFYERSMIQFAEQLRKFKFTKITKEAFEDEEDIDAEENEKEATMSLPKVWLYYEHPKFRRDEVGLIEQIEGSNELYEYVPIATAAKKDLFDDCIGEPSNSHHLRKRERGDLCSRIVGNVSRLEQARLRLHMQVRFQREQEVLMHKVTEADTVAVKKVEHKGARIVTRVTNEPVVQLPDDKFESPLETNLEVQNTLNPELAGFYGIYDFHKIKSFFGEYLPKRQNENIVVDVPELKLGNDQPKKKKDEEEGKRSVDEIIRGDVADVADDDDFEEDVDDDKDEDYGLKASHGKKISSKSLKSKKYVLRSSSKKATNSKSVDDEIQMALNSLCDETDDKSDEKEKMSKDSSAMDLESDSEEELPKKMKFNEDDKMDQSSEEEELNRSNSFLDFLSQFDNDGDDNAEHDNDDMDFELTF